jgi:tetratricopeptide (TPR) repeat protein
MYAQDYYHILEILPEATTAEVKESFRRLARLHHPDLNPNNAAAEARFKLICQAYNVLSDPDQRQRYDLQHFPNQDFPSKAKPPKTPPGKASGNPSGSAHTAEAGSLPQYQQLYRQGLDAVARREYRQALDLFGEALQLRPDYWEAYLERAQIYYIQSKDRSALEDCNEVIRRHPQSSQAYYLQGRARHRLGYLADALEAYSQAIAHNSAYAQAYYYRGAAQLETQSFSAAIRDFQAAQELYHQQQDRNGYTLATNALTRLKRRPSSLFAHLRGTGQDTLMTLRAYLPNPYGNLLPAFTRLSPDRSLGVGLGLSLLAQAGFVLATCLFYSRLSDSPYWDWRDLLPGVLFFSLVPLLCLLMVAALWCKLLHRWQGWPAHLFLAGAAFVPLSLGYLVGVGLGQISPLLILGAAVFAGSHTILTLYSGYTQIHHCSESQATWMIPTQILITLVITYGFRNWLLFAY